MPDIAGLTASAACLTGAATGKVYGFLTTTNRVPSQIQEFIQGLESLNTALDTLKKCADKYPKSEALNLLSSLDTDKPGTLQKCAQELKALISKLELKKRRSRGSKGRFAWPLRRPEILQIISRFERHKSTFIIAVNADNISASREFALCIAQGYYKVDIGLYKSNNGYHKADGRKRKKFYWIYPGDFNTRHTEITNRRQKNLGNWILWTAEFTEWTSTPDSGILWGHGVPGAGKTFLSSIVIDHLEKRVVASNLGVAHIYFDYAERDQQEPILVLASLIKQLASQIPNTVTELDRLYDQLEPKRRSSTIKQLFATLLLIAKRFSRTYLIFDGLDECDPEKQRKVLLPLFYSMAKNGIKLFVTSRPHPVDIRNSLKNTAKIRLLARREDIESYIQQKIDENPKAKHLVRGKCGDRIVSELINCANGMLLPVQFHIEYICQQTSTNQILAALGRLKNSSTQAELLDPTYDRVIEKIRRQPKIYADLALKVLVWIVKARRPLTINELRVIVSIEQNQHKLDQLNTPDEKTLLGVCAGLVVIDETSSNRTIRLAHYTVQKYLLARSIIPGDSDLKVIAACTAYLALDKFKNKAYRRYEKLDPLVKYTVDHLKTHLAACDERLTASLILTLVTGQGRNYCASLYASRNIRWPTPRITEFTQLDLASMLGHSIVVQHLINETANFPDRDNFLAVMYAVWGKHKAVVGQLLNHGSSGLSGADEELLFAEFSERYHILQLVENGTNISAQNNHKWTALYLATREGNKALCRLLLENGIHTMIRSNDGCTAPHLAVKKWNEVVCQLFLENGIDTPVKDNDGST